ncbi:MAG: synthase [Pseudomonadota bacterium]
MTDWIGGNRITLLENGEAYFPRVFDCIAQARREVVLETFILFEDRVGLQLHAALVAAGRRGVRVDVTVDGWGSPDLSEGFIRTLAEAGVRLHVFDPGPRPFGLRPKALRRLHRKIVVVDGQVAFVGGINYSADHLADYGPLAKQDYAVEILGPLVAVIHRYTHAALAQGLRHRRPHAWWFARRPPRLLPTQLPYAGTAQALFVVRDNVRHKDDIERHYRDAIRAARHRVVIANAYFFPGYRLVRELRLAARRGVDVRLVLQGRPDMAIARTAAITLYHHLLKAGVRIFEYRERPLHGKIALADEDWATVGSSNLDPLSLALNLEANVFIRDRAFNASLYAHLQGLLRAHCVEVDAATLPPVGGLALVRSYLAFHVMRKFPRWAQALPPHAPRLQPAFAKDPP